MKEGAMTNLEPTPEELASLLDKRVYGDDLTDTQRAERVFRDHAYEAAVSIVSLAKHAPNDNTKFRAAQYVIDRACGPVNKDSGAPKPGEQDPLVDAMELLNKAILEDPR